MAEIIGYDEGEARMTWPGLCTALEVGHTLPRAQITDSFLYRGADTLLSRAAWIDGLGLAVKSATIFPGNAARDLPSVNGGVSLYSDSDGTLSAIIDFHLVTKWKTAGDSLLAATKLARKDSRDILIVGAGSVARSLHAAYSSAFPDARFTVWNRSRAGAERLAAACPGVTIADDLETAVRSADIVTSATMATEPLIRGDWLQPGQHVDLIGAFRPDMREADDTALQRARVFVDSRDTTLDHIGELKIPLQSGAISRDTVLADYYDLQGGAFARRTDDEITLFKNGGGAHLDLMTSRYILDAWQTRPAS
ncbi:ornithine cyclodeaminase family protein [Rhodovulum adriaticum]|uniref:Ornithine cyclodeaminase n=1 Tax=Rhodovulum adriaticum TaxID=35804 RepID=A0A4R2NHT0_RHOAD|nr:ornithine cyclodeaminase [Rhodovulum adriaticum]MBK1637261.1 ornithine cyclodeaminase [Rhodovulum adriaticum]TCP20931.1 ornithine cyclodeaminase [Rhodovulum adriaticum]